MVFAGHRAAFDVFPLYVFNASHCMLINILFLFRKKTWACHAVSMDNSTVMNQCVFRGMEENKER